MLRLLSASASSPAGYFRCAGDGLSDLALAEPVFIVLAVTFPQIATPYSLGAGCDEFGEAGDRQRRQRCLYRPVSVATGVARVAGLKTLRWLVNALCVGVLGYVLVRLTLTRRPARTGYSYAHVGAGRFLAAACTLFGLREL